MTHAQYDTVLAHCFDGFPDEACGLLAGPFADGAHTGEVGQVYPCRNADGSARTYTVDSKDLLAAMRDADDHGHDIIGVWHSHTHTDAYPSATDVRQAVDTLDDAGRAAALASLRDALAAHEGPDGIVLDSGIWLVTARR